MGKTRLLEALIPLVPGAAVIKWTHHHLGPDKPGSDTARLGVHQIPVILAHPDAVVIRTSATDRAAVYTRAAQWLDDQAVLLVEGDKHGPGPVVWIGGEVPADIASCLVIGPNPPAVGRWLPATLPLTEDGAREAAQYMKKHLALFTYYWARSSYGELH